MPHHSQSVRWVRVNPSVKIGVESLLPDLVCGNGSDRVGLLLVPTEKVAQRVASMRNLKLRPKIVERTRPRGQAL